MKEINEEDKQLREEAKENAKRAESILNFLRGGDNSFLLIALAQHLATCEDCNQKFVEIIDCLKMKVTKNGEHK